MAGLEQVFRADLCRESLHCSHPTWTGILSFRWLSSHS